MKKILCVVTLFTCVLQVFADSTDIMRRALYEVAQHPKELSDSQAIQLYLNPGMTDTVRTDNIVLAQHFSIIPFKTRWINKSINSAIWFKNGWQRIDNIIIYNKDVSFSTFINLSLILLVMIFLIRSIADQLFFKNNIKREAQDVVFGDVERVIKHYHYEHVRRRTILYRKEFVWMLGVFMLIVGVTELKSDIWFYVSVGWWLILVGFIAFHFRNIISKKVYNSVRVKYQPQNA